MFKLALSTLVFGGYALASGGGGDSTPPNYYNYSYSCLNSSKTLQVTLSTKDAGGYVPFKKAVITSSKDNIDQSYSLNDDYRFNSEDRLNSVKKEMPKSLSHGDLKLWISGKEIEVSGYSQYRDMNHHIELFARKKSGIEIVIYRLENESLIYNEKLNCALKIESNEAQ